MNSEILIFVLAAAALVAFVVVVLQFTSAMRRMSEHVDRAAERNQIQRDRLLQVAIEKLQVTPQTEAAVRLAQMHSGEFREVDKRHVLRDQATDIIDTRKRAFEQQQKHAAAMPPKEATPSGEKDAFE